MFKLLLAAFLVFISAPVLADVPTEEELNISHFRETGEFRTTGEYDGSPSGSLYEATQSGDDETVCIAAGGDNCGSSGGGSGSGGSPKGGATQEDIQEAVNAYALPTSTRSFSLGNLNSNREASLIISSGNEENNVIFRVIRLMAMLVGTVAIILYIVAGYFMIFSQGEENQLTKGKQIITFTSLGLVIAFGAYMIVQLVMGLIYFSN